MSQKKSENSAASAPPLKKHYFEQVVPALMAGRGYKNKHQVPKLEKIVLNTGITDFTIFPEITVESAKRSMGLDITLVTSAHTDDEARELLKLLGMPFRRSEAAAAKTTAA